MASNPQRIAELQRELGANPASRQFYQLGELLRRDGKAVEAVTALRAGLRHHPRYVAAWVSLGRACLDAGKPAEASVALRRAIELDSGNPVAWRLDGEAMLALGRRFDALAAMQRALELVPGDEVLQAAVEALSSSTAPGAATVSAPAPAPLVLASAAGEDPFGAAPDDAAVAGGDVFAPAATREADEAPAPLAAATAAAESEPATAAIQEDPASEAAAEALAAEPAAMTSSSATPFDAGPSNAPPPAPLAAAAADPFGLDQPPPVADFLSDVVLGAEPAPPEREQSEAAHGAAQGAAHEAAQGAALEAAQGAAHGAVELSPFDQALEATDAIQPMPEAPAALPVSDDSRPEPVAAEESAREAAAFPLPGEALVIDQPPPELEVSAAEQEPPPLALAPEAEAAPAGDDAIAPGDADEAAPVEQVAAMRSAEPPVGLAGQPAGPATLTMARLYLQQQQVDAAAATLEQLLELDPGHQEARDLLELVREMMEPMPAALPPLSRRERKIAALQRWLACLTLGRERIAS